MLPESLSYQAIRLISAMPPHGVISLSLKLSSSSRAMCRFLSPLLLPSAPKALQYLIAFSVTYPDYSLMAVIRNYRLMTIPGLIV